MTQGDAVMRQFEGDGAEASTSGSACRDLVAVGPARSRDDTRPRSATRSSAVFLAHLIATAKDFPQTREKRRLGPDEALRLYGAVQTCVQPKRVRLASL
jgi:hypothetical protein